MSLSKRIVYLRDFAAEADKLKATWGKTTLYSSGDTLLDNYLGGGFGRPDGYEIVLMYGDTGIGKSTVALNFLKPAIEANKKIGFLVLEDDGPDVYLRMQNILPRETMKKYVFESDNLHFMPQEDLVKSWNLDDLLALIEDWFTTRDLDLILLDHLQFAFEGAESIKGENEYIAQRIFMQKLNQLMKRVKKTIILISHVNKTGTAKGMGKIVGSGAIAQAGTKIIEISDDQMEDTIRLYMRKSRFTPRREYHFAMKLKEGILRSAA